MAYCNSCHHANPAVIERRVSRQKPGHYHPASSGTGRYFLQPTAGIERDYDGRGRPPDQCPDCDDHVMKLAEPSAYFVTHCIICLAELERSSAKTCSQKCRSAYFQVRRRVKQRTAA